MKRSKHLSKAVRAKISAGVTRYWREVHREQKKHPRFSLDRAKEEVLRQREKAERKLVPKRKGKPRVAPVAPEPSAGPPTAPPETGEVPEEEMDFADELNDAGAEEESDSP